jgi:hypothetical protein
MKDRVEPDVPQESADGLSAEVPQDADTRTTPESNYCYRFVHRCRDRAVRRGFPPSKGEVNAYAEIEYVQAHLDELESIKNAAVRAVRSFNWEFPVLPNGSPDLSNASQEDLHTYLGLLTTTYEAMGTYIHWLRIITGAESAIADGKMSLAEIYASERKASDRDDLQTM